MVLYNLGTCSKKHGSANVQIPETAFVSEYVIPLRPEGFQEQQHDTSTNHTSEDSTDRLSNLKPLGDEL